MLANLKMGPWSLDEWTPDASEKLSAIVVALGKSTRVQALPYSHEPILRDE